MCSSDLEVHDQMANLIVAQLLFLESEGDKDISMYINSPGGSVTAGMAIYDTMQFIKPDVHTIVMGQACSMGSLLAQAGAPGKRFMLPNARHMIHQPSGGAGGQATDMEIQVNEIKVYVSGEVQKPGVYLLASGSRVIDALNKAGGLNKKGVIGENNLARQIEDGEQIDFPNVVHESKNFTKKSQKQNNCINLNTAQTSELEELPGVGPVLAERITKWREENKKFNTVEDLSLVDGIGQSKLVKISEKACV